jgi:DNA-binding HxlR family transcriptional regulator
MAVLDEAGSPVRYSRVPELINGVSQKSLTKTLRLVEQDGLVERTIFAEVPPLVDDP